MNILFVADVSIKGIEGGANRVLYEEATRLATRGHQVCILTRKQPETLSDEEDIEGVKEYRYEINLQNPLTFLFSTIKNSKRLFETLIENCPFHIINFHQPFSALGVLLSRKSRPIKRVYTCHSLAFEEYQTRQDKPRGKSSLLNYKLHILGMKLIEKYCISQSHKVITLSEYTKQKLIVRHHVPEHKMTVIPGGVDIIKFRPSKDKEALRKKLNIPVDKFILLTVRNLVPRMGLENLIHAMALLIQKIENIYLIIGGEGILKADLETLIEQKALHHYIKLTGFIPEEELPLFYQMADLFILPTKDLEGFGLVTLEALASGLPVLGTPVGGTVEILSRFNRGLLFEKADPESIAHLILEKYREFHERPEAYDMLARQCRAFIENHYTWDKQIDRFEAQAKEVLSS